MFGLKLNLPVHEVEAICARYSDPRTRLLHIIIDFLEQAEPRPTWRVIVNALRSPIVNLTALARKVEAVHFPDLTATRDVVPETTGKSLSVPLTCVRVCLIIPDTKPAVNDTVSTATSSEAVKKTIEELKIKFRTLKNNIRGGLEKQRVPVDQVADSLTSLSPDDEDHHKLFTRSQVSNLFRAASVAEQFGTMNSHWNYLDPSLLDHVVRDFNLEEVKDEMETYKSYLGQFRKKTPLTLFCQAQEQRDIDMPPNFRKVVTDFKWPQNAKLEDVEQFRQKFAHYYSLHDCAMMVAEVRPGCFIVTWFVPESVVEKLKGKVPRAILKEYSVTKLEIAGTCVYRLRKPQEVSVTGSIPIVCSILVPLSFHYQAVPSTSSGPVSAATAAVPG